MFSYKNNNLLPILITNNRRSDNNSSILLGFDKVIVFDHLSKVPISSSIRTNFNGKLSIIRVDGIGNIKLRLMQNALDIAAKNNYSWMLYLDADEFLNLNKFNNIKPFLDIFKDADAIGINWLMFGTSGYKEQPKGLITDNFIRSEIRLNKY